MARPRGGRRLLHALATQGQGEPVVPTTRHWRKHLHAGVAPFARFDAGGEYRGIEGA